MVFLNQIGMMCSTRIKQKSGKDFPTFSPAGNGNSAFISSSSSSSTFIDNKESYKQISLVTTSM